MTRRKGTEEAKEEASSSAHHPGNTDSEREGSGDKSTLQRRGSRDTLAPTKPILKALLAMNSLTDELNLQHVSLCGGHFLTMTNWFLFTKVQRKFHEERMFFFQQRCWNNSMQMKNSNLASFSIIPVTRIDNGLKLLGKNTGIRQSS